MKFFSKKWVGSTQPRKQRKYRSNAPLHIKRKLLAAHVSKTLRKEINKRSMVLRKGDEVIIMRGEFRGKKGIVSEVNLKKSKIFIDNVKKKKVSGQEIMIPTDPSNVQITKLKMEDKMRKRIVGRSQSQGTS